MDIKDPFEVVTVIAGQQDANFYARFLYDFFADWTWAADGSTASVTLSHDDLSDVTLASTGDDPKVTITSTEARDEDDNVIGTRYTATATYTLNGYDYTFTDHKDVLTPEPAAEAENVALSETEANTDALWDVLGEQANVTLSGRTLYKDGSWNTLCLPFDVALEGSPLEGATLKTLASSDYDAATGTLTLNFADATAIEGGRPYLVKWTKPDGYDGHASDYDITAPVFSGVTINGIMGGAAGSMYVDMMGTVSPVILTGGDRSVLYLGAGNTLYYPSAALTIGSCRAYFALHNGITAGDLPNEARAFVLRFVENPSTQGDNFGDGETTGISLTPAPSPKGEGSEYYDMLGRRLSGKPTQSGLYVNHGKKVVIK